MRCPALHSLHWPTFYYMVSKSNVIFLPGFANKLSEVWHVSACVCVCERHAPLWRWWQCQLEIVAAVLCWGILYRKCVQVSPHSLDNAEDLAEWFREVVIVRLAVRTDEAAAVVAEGLWELGVGPDHLQSALVARQAGGAARSSGEYIVRVHRPEHQH